MIKSILYILIICLSLLPANAIPIQVNDKDNDLSLLEHSEVFIDKGATLGHAEVMPASFSPYESNSINRGYTTDEAVWVRFTLQNDSNETLTRQLHVNNSMLDVITLFDEEGEVESQGVLNRPPYEGILDFHFEIMLQPKESKTYFVRLFTNSCATYFHLTLESNTVLWQKNLNRQLILSAFFAVIIALALYNLLLFLFTREKIYIFYTLLMLSISNNHFSYTSMSLPLLSNWLTQEELKTFTHIDAYLGIYYLAGLIIFLLLFAREFLKLKHFKVLDLLIKVQITLVVLILILNSDDFYLLDYLIYLSITSLLYLMALALYFVYKKVPNSIYFMFGIGISLLGHLFWIFYNTGLYIPKGGHYWYFYELSVVVEAILFSVILAKRLNHTKALEASIKTQKVLTKELHHRVKNNMQFIISLYRLKLKKHLDTQGKVMLKEAEQNIISMGKMHEILYDQKNIDTIDASNYFSELLDELKKSFDTQGIEITIKSHQVEIKAEQIIYCGIIINELVTNALKYAFDHKGGTVSIEITSHNKEKILTVKDNGKGFNVDPDKHSFGLTLVNNLSENELNGTHHLTSHKGTTHTIRWS